MKIKKIITLVACVCLLSISLVIPAFAVVTEISGDGYALYNGVKLPDIDSVWTDRTTYPYAAIGEYFGDDEFELCLSSSPFVMVEHGGGLSYALQFGGPAIAYTLADGWQFLGEGENDSGEPISSCDIFWSNHEVLYEDNSVYLAASDPISLDGYNLVEWDGDTNGLDIFVDNYYCVLNRYLPAVDAFSVMELSYANNPVVFDVIHTESSGWYIEGPTSTYGSSVSSVDLSADSFTTFLKFDDIDDTGYTKLLAYRTVETPPDEGGGEDDDPHPPCGG